MRTALLGSLVSCWLVAACGGGDDDQSAGSPDAGPDGEPALGICAYGWCFANPIPQPNLVTSLLAFSEDDYWGVAGRTFHWDGASWSTLQGDPTLFDVVIGTGPRDLWFGGTTITHWDGSTSHAYVEYEDAEVYDLFRVADDDILAVGTAGLGLRWNGSDWAISGLPTAQDIMAVWGRGKDDIWAVGVGTPAEPGIRMHWNGTQWQQIDAGAPCTFMALWGDTPARGWGRCRTGELQYWNGASFQQVPDPSPGDSIQVAGTAESAWSVDAVGYVKHWDGESWATLVEGSPDGEGRIGFFAIAELGSDRIMAGGDYGSIARCDAAACTWLASGPASPHFDLKATWGANPSDVWAVGDGIAHWDGSAWQPAELPAEADGRTLYAIHGTSSSDVWAVGDTRDDSGTETGVALNVLHYDGEAWTHVDTGQIDQALYGVWAGAPDDVWAVGGGVGAGFTVHFDGSSWTASDTPGEMSAVWGAPGGGQVIAAGQDGALVRWDGEQWTSEGEWSGDPLTWFETIWGASADDVWAAGEKDYMGFLAHWDGEVWTGYPDQPLAFVFSLGGTASDDVWAAGNYGTFMHWDGESWSDQGSLHTEGSIEGVTSSLSGSWMVGNEGLIVYHPASL